MTQSTQALSKAIARRQPLPKQARQASEGTRSGHLALVAVPILAIGFVALAPSLLASFLAIKPALAVFACLLLTSPLLVVWGLGAARQAARLAKAEAALRSLDGGRGDPAEVASRIEHSAKETLRILGENARRNIHFVDELRESIYRSASIAGETRILDEVVTGLTASVASSSEGVEGIVRAIDNLAGKVEEQASAVNQIGASLEEMNASIKSIAAITGQRNASIQSLRERAGEGQEQLRRLDALIVRTKTDVETIVKMTGAISDIATRTDLLSMNAAIEAAHAGAAGRGFSIVAKEIRGLSESVTSNVNSIIEALARIQKSIAAVRDLSGENVVTFEAFGKEIMGFADSFREIGGATAEASVGTQEIVAASSSLTEVSETVRAGAQAIRSGVFSVEGLMTTVRGACEKTALTIDRLTGNVKASNSGLDGLTNSIVGMRNDMMGISALLDRGAASGGADASRLMAQHLQWVIRARLAMDGQLAEEARKLGDHTKCDLGKWMDSAGAASVRSSKRFSELDASHRRLHAIANEIIATASSAPIEENEERFDKLLATSAVILGSLPSLLESEGV